jgi:hypothetical protein
MNDMGWLDEGELKRIVARNRADRKRDRRIARDQCRGLPVGGSFTMALPEGEPARREAYSEIAGQAFGVFGKGRYRVTSGVGGASITITRRLS